MWIQQRNGGPASRAAWISASVREAPQRSHTAS